MICLHQFSVLVQTVLSLIVYKFFTMKLHEAMDASLFSPIFYSLISYLDFYPVKLLKSLSTVRYLSARVEGSYFLFYWLLLIYHLFVKKKEENPQPFKILMSQNSTNQLRTLVKNLFQKPKVEENTQFLPSLYYSSMKVICAPHINQNQLISNSQANQKQYFLV